MVVIAFMAATRVADTREGLVAEAVTLLAGLAGVSLFLYGLVAMLSHSQAAPTVAPPAAHVEKVHNAGELLVGAAGLLVAAILLTGIATTAGVLWALLGAVLLSPMIAGSGYLCLRFARAPRRDWKIDLQKLRSPR